VDDSLDPKKRISLKADTIDIFETAWERFAVKPGGSVGIEASVFVDKLAGRLQQLKSHLIPAMQAKASKSAKVRKQLKELAAEQGFAGFVEDIDEAIAGQYAYRLIGQILFYFALRRKQPSLKPLVVKPSDSLPSSLRPFWDDVRRFDYEALFKVSVLDDLVPFPSSAEIVTTHEYYRTKSADTANARVQAKLLRILEMKGPTSKRELQRLTHAHRDGTELWNRAPDGLLRDRAIGKREDGAYYRAE
jgi:hypothetical protein